MVCDLAFDDIAGDRVDAEGDAGDIGIDHPLDDDGHGRRCLVAARMRPVGDGGGGAETFRSLNAQIAS